MPYLVIDSHVRAYDDVASTNNPQRRFVDWKRSQTGNVALSVLNPRSEQYQLAGSESRTIFSGVRSTSLDNTTQISFSLLSTSDTYRYRFKWTGVGTNPVFRTSRGLALSGVLVTITINANATARFTSLASTYSAVQVGDVVYIPGTSTGDAAGPFNSLNEGYWTVVSVSGTGNYIEVTRTGDDFEAYAEAITPTTNTALVAFSSAGLQVGDKVEIVGGFSATLQNAFTISYVTHESFDIITTEVLPTSETVVPATSNIKWYYNAKRFTRIEADRPVLVRVNGDTGSYQKIVPWTENDAENIGEWQFVGTVYQLVIVNKSVDTANVSIISAE